MEYHGMIKIIPDNNRLKSFLFKGMFFILMNFCLGCDFSNFVDKAYPFIIVNNSSHSIGLYRADGRDGSSAYPDTVLPLTNKYVMDVVAKSGNEVDLAPQISWEQAFTYLPADTLSVFIFHSDTLKKYSWQEVRDGYKILKRYDLSLEDLKKNNYKVTYP